jgi:hypothetical protein
LKKAKVYLDKLISEVEKKWDLLNVPIAS